MQISYSEKLPSISEWKILRQSAGWTVHTDEDFQNATHGTLFGISVYDQKRIVGMGRVVGDGAICFYIQDVVVISEYEQKGIGTEIMNRLLSNIEKCAAPNAVIALMSSQGKESFYARFGFIRRTGANTGYGMYLP